LIQKEKEKKKKAGDISKHSGPGPIRPATKTKQRHSVPGQQNPLIKPEKNFQGALLA
jgi:hypothetical protein